MPVNHYFDNIGNSAEQRLLEDLTIESIRIHGVDVIYCPRTLNFVDDILNEDDLSTFDSAYTIEMYIVNVDGFGGEGDFLSKFGLQIRDSMSLAVARRTFEDNISNVIGTPRPNEGDVFYFPLNKKIFKVMHVEHEAVFYQTGTLPFYELRTELFEYSGERFNTGVPEVDNLYVNYDMTTNTAYDDPSSVEDSIAQNLDIQDEANTWTDFSEADPYSEGGKW